MSENDDKKDEKMAPQFIGNFRGASIRYNRALGNLFAWEYNTSNLEYTEGDKIGNVIGSTIINRSLVDDAFNRILNKYGDEEAAKTLIDISELIQKSGDSAAGVLLDSFNQELNKSQPEKTKLMNIWSGIEKIVPPVVTFSGLIAKVVNLA